MPKTNETDWELIMGIVEECEEHLKENGVDQSKWGLCEKCGVSESCPNMRLESILPHLKV